MRPAEQNLGAQHRWTTGIGTHRSRLRRFIHGARIDGRDEEEQNWEEQGHISSFERSNPVANAGLVA